MTRAESGASRHSSSRSLGPYCPTLNTGVVSAWYVWLSVRDRSQFYLEATCLAFAFCSLFSSSVPNICLFCLPRVNMMESLVAAALPLRRAVRLPRSAAYDSSHDINSRDTDDFSCSLGFLASHLCHCCFGCSSDYPRSLLVRPSSTAGCKHKHSGESASFSEHSDEQPVPSW